MAAVAAQALDGVARREWRAALAEARRRAGGEQRHEGEPLPMPETVPEPIVVDDVAPPLPALPPPPPPQPVGAPTDLLAPIWFEHKPKGGGPHSSSKGVFFC